MTLAQVSRTLTQRISAYAGVVLETVAYAGTGDVLKVQRLLALCGEHTEVDEASAWKVPLLRRFEGFQPSSARVYTNS